MTTTDRDLCWKPVTAEDGYVENCGLWENHAGPCLLVCGDCRAGRCHIPIRPPRPGVGDPHCGCARHASSIAAWKLADDEPEPVVPPLPEPGPYLDKDGWTCVIGEEGDVTYPGNEETWRPTDYAEFRRLVDIADVKDLVDSYEEIARDRCCDVHGYGDLLACVNGRCGHIAEEIATWRGRGAE